MTFGLRIKEPRNSLGISLKSLSARLRIDRAYLSRVEAGKVPPSDGLISRLADVGTEIRDGFIFGLLKLIKGLSYFRNNPSIESLCKF